MSQLYLIERMADPRTDKRERQAALRRLGPEGRLTVYRRAELSFEVCCLWASLWPHEVPLLQGEFEFIALATPEVCE